MAEAARLRDLGHGAVVSYSRKVFIPLTRLCRDTCRYCTFVRGPRGAATAYLSPDEVLAIARAGAAAGCHEALFTLGDKPELKYEAARRALARLGHATTIDYLAAMCALVLRETGLLPHVNPGVMSGDRDCRAPSRIGVAGPHAGEAFRRGCASAAGRTTARRTSRRPCGSRPSRRRAGCSVPFTTGILIGIGETRASGSNSLLAIRDAASPARPHPGGHRPEFPRQGWHRHGASAGAGRDELLWTVAMARIVLGPQMNIQAPPNLSPGTDRRSSSQPASTTGAASRR